MPSWRGFARSCYDRLSCANRTIGQAAKGRLFSSGEQENITVERRVLATAEFRAAAPEWPRRLRVSGACVRNPDSLRASAMASLCVELASRPFMPDTVDAARQDVDQEAADELVRRQRHDLLAFGPVATVVLAPERHAGILEGDEPPVRNGDAGVARERRQHRLQPGKVRLGLDHPALLPDRRQMPQEGLACGEACQGAEEGQLAGIEQCLQARDSRRNNAPSWLRLRCPAWVAR